MYGFITVYNIAYGGRCGDTREKSSARETHLSSLTHTQYLSYTQRPILEVVVHRQLTHEH